MNWRKISILLAIPIIFFVISFLTLKDYGISWDEPIHFFRGQAYLHFFLTGRLNYDDLRGRRSYYQNNSLRGEYFLTNDGGHPPLNGILAALSNWIFYQKLNLLGDLDSLHLFNIFISSLLVLVVCLFAYQTYGLLAGVVTGLVTASYPLFFAEGHFNIKDPAEASFFALTTYFLWLSLINFNWKWLLASSILFALGLGTKFNILFLPFIIIPYLAIRFFPERGNLRIFFGKISTTCLIILAMAPILITILFYLTWPFLWQHPRGNLLKVIDYYRGIGTGGGYETSYRFLKVFNTYPIFWIIVTTPPFFLILTLVGILSGFKLKEKTKVFYLWLLWLFVPILRVTLPNSAIYGGDRQIMEFLPAMALISGIGGRVLWGWIVKVLKRLTNLSSKLIATSLIMAFFIPNLFVLVKLHPNENVYFNFLVGGLRGAKEKNIPYWGNSFGNAYLQGVKWLNQNASYGASVAMIQGTGTNIPRFQLRSDINLSNISWSGIDRKGEYLLELTHQDPVRIYPYEWDYIREFLDPIYEVKVDGVAIAKVWKNNWEHTKSKWRKKEISLEGIEAKIDPGIITINLNGRYKLSRLIINFLEKPICDNSAGDVYTKINDSFWREEEESLSTHQVEEDGVDLTNKVQFFFPGREAEKIKIIAKGKSCLLNNPQFKILILR